MAIHVQIQDEWGIREGNQCIWESHFVTEAIVRADISTYSCLRFLDPYGDTTFNYLQIEVLLTELQRVRGQVTDPAHLQALEELSQLVQRAGDRQQYVKFIGD